MRWLVMSLLLLCVPLAALAQVRVLALFPGKAMLEVDGQRKVLAKGQSLGGVTLLDADTAEALVSVDGRQQALRLGSTVSTSYAQAKHREIRLLGTGDSFFIDGLINGKPVRMLVDTGATTIAISERQARDLGLQYVIDGRPTHVRTASGVAAGYDLRLRSLKLGEISFNDVAAVVVQGDSPRHVLLGMNVLNRFDVQHDGNLMVLRAKR